ncbi:MAG: DUF1501 domain-containing protein [Planctomycetales bacterium]
MRRRSFISLSMAGFSGAAALRNCLAAKAKKAHAKQVLVVFEQGGLCHLDSLDPKPEAATEHRSPNKPISTNVSGIQISSLMPKTAQQLDKLTLVRCMHHPTPTTSGHPKGSQYVLSGEVPGGPTEMPDIGSAVAHRLGTQARFLPAYIMIPSTSEQAKESRLGFLPPSSKVFKTGGTDVADPKWSVPNLGLSGDTDKLRFRDRLGLLNDIDVGLVGTAESENVEAVESLSEQARDMLTNPRTAGAFDLSTESPKTLEKYGEGHRGRCYLLGRKLIEAGARFVTVDVRWPSDKKKFPGGTNLNWDHHGSIYTDASCNTKVSPGNNRWGIGSWIMMGSTDQAFAALLEDMDERGLLKETLVCFISEFGRTPKINSKQGRDHWVHAHTFAFAGAKTPGGQVVGATDKQGGYVASSVAYTPTDYAATLYEKLGIDREEPYHTASDRPIFLARDGRPIREIF